jgi:hypothetical protein
VEQPSSEDAAVTKKRQREEEVEESDVFRMDSSPTQASLVSDSASKIGGRGRHMAAPLPIVEGGVTVLPLSTQSLPLAVAAAPPITASASSASAASPAKRRASPAEAPLATFEPAVAFVAPVPPVAAAKWQFKVDLRKGASRDEAWEDYPAADCGTIEAAFLLYDAAVTGTKKKPKKTVVELKLNSTYGIHFEDMVQFRFDDRSRQRPIRRKKN